jgi:2-iminoacetate synthase ThiH
MEQVINAKAILKKKPKEEKVQGRSYTSNATKLLKHLDRLEIIQKGGRPKPVMFHMSPANPCNLTCSFCCFANRSMKEMLTVAQMKSAIDQFVALGVLGYGVYRRWRTNSTSKTR